MASRRQFFYLSGYGVMVVPRLAYHKGVVVFRLPLALPARVPVAFRAQIFQGGKRLAGAFLFYHRYWKQPKKTNKKAIN